MYKFALGLFIGLFISYFYGPNSNEVSSTPLTSTCSVEETKLEANEESDSRTLNQIVVGRPSKDLEGTNKIREEVSDSASKTVESSNPDIFVQSLWKLEIPNGKPTYGDPQADGTFLSIEETESEGVVSKKFHNGELALVEWRRADGSYLVRTYYEDGSPKGLSYGPKPKTNIVNITYSRSGDPVYKLVPAENGTMSVSKFNEYGELLEGWIITFLLCCEISSVEALRISAGASGAAATASSDNYFFFQRPTASFQSLSSLSLAFFSRRNFSL